jgi:radical SAM superfamily enzyme YgiQ (UPF0313 family)
MNITFVYPDHESLGIQYLMSLTRLRGHRPQLVLYPTGDNFHSDPVKSPADLFSRMFEKKNQKPVFYEGVAETILRTQPDLVAFSCVTDNFEHQLRVAQCCKRIRPDLFTIFGGVHVTSVPEQVLQCPEVDMIAIGEAERSFSELLEAGFRKEIFSLPDRQVKGIVIKREGQLIGDFVEGDLEDLNTLPFPEKRPWYGYRGLEYMRTDYKTMTSRGCPYRCSYCCNDMFHALRGRSLIRRRSVAGVIEELTFAKNENKDLRSVHFWDDCFTSDKQWLRDFSKEYKAKIALPFQCLAIPQTCDAETVDILVDMGCVGAQLGVQSLSATLNKNILFRSFDLEKIKACLLAFQKSGVRVFVDHILGIPEDTLENQEKALLFYNRIRPFRIHPFWLTFYPKTNITSAALKKGFLTQERYQEIISGRNCGASLLLASSRANKSLKKYIPVSFLLKYIPILPSWFVSALVRTRFFHLLGIKNYAFSTLMPDYIKTVGGWGPFLKLCFADFVIRLKNDGKVTATKSGILIVEASYGANCAQEGMRENFKGNITRALSRKCNGKKRVEFQVDVNALGDPAPGSAKDLSVSWRYADDPQMTLHSLYVPAEAHGKKILIPEMKGEVK